MQQIKTRAGIGARAPHIAQILSEQPKDIGWVEVHPENYMSAGGACLDELEALGELYPLSLHGVGLSLVSSEGLDQQHLDRLKSLVDRMEPVLVSEHLAWSAWDGRFFNDLLPVPMSQEALEVAVARIDETQYHLGRRILIENPSLYGHLPENIIPEPEFLAALAHRTGCGLLLDVNNVAVSANNLGFDARAWLEGFPVDDIGEIHLAGHAVIEFEGRRLCIDDHGSKITDEVWDLAQYLLSLSGARPILIERDKNIPPFEDLRHEARRAQLLLDNLTAERQGSWDYKISSADLQPH